MNGIKLEKKGEKFIALLYFDYDLDILNTVRSIDGRYWNSAEKVWEIDIRKDTISNILSLCKKFKFDIHFSKDDLLKALKENSKVFSDPEEDGSYDLPEDKDYLVFVKRKSKMKIFLVFGYSPVLVEEVKAIPGARFIKNTRRTGWEISINLNNINEVKEYLENSYVYCEDPTLLADISDIVNSKSSLSKKSRAIEGKSSNIQIKGLSGELRPFQKIGVEYALKTKKTFIADDMGCGKTIEALATYQASSVDKCLVVCPYSVKYNWLIEAQKWLPNKKSVVLEINKEKDGVKDFGNINIINYNMLTKVWPLIEDKGIKMAIFDESHRLMHKQTNWSKAAVQLSKGLDYCLLLSGTPILNRPNELINQLAVIDKLSLFGGEWEFKKRYCGLKRTAFGWDDSGASNLDELHERLRSVCYIRRMKSQVLSELPSKQRSYIPIKLESKGLREYQKAEQDIADWIIHNQKEIRSFFAKLKSERLKNEKYFETLTKLKVQRAETLIKISKLRKLAAELKVKYFLEWIEDFMHTDRKLIIFAVHVDIINELRDKLKKYDPVVINGENSAKERQENVERFQNDPNTRIIICNIQAGGVGLTLTAASDVAFLEFPWTISEVLQAEDRAYRLGQSNNVNVWYFFAEDTIDLDMISSLQKKEKVTSTITDGISAEDSGESIIEDSVKGLLEKYKQGAKKK